MFKKVFKILIYIFAIIGFLLVVGFFAIKFGWTNTNGVIDRQRENFLSSANFSSNTTLNQNLTWNQDKEWQTLKSAILKDKAVIYRASASSGIPPRLLVTELVVEQLRLFHTDRESFKKFFEPLKILGSQTQFSWGVMGVKEETAIEIENNLKDNTSPFYLGMQFEHLLDYFSPKQRLGETIVEDKKQERFVKMTDQHDHYWSYLYAGLYLKQVETQWKNAGFDISDKSDIISTLYNVGFTNSKPNKNPQSGGAEIKINDISYSFGSLAKEFYNSNELLDEFPR